MILKFPDLKSLRLALISGAVPATMSKAPAIAGVDDQHQCWVETNATLTRSNQTELKRLLVSFPRSMSGVSRQEYGCWAEILPLEKEPWHADTLTQTPVLFDLSDGAELASLVIETLRLGNDRQSYRWLETLPWKGGASALLPESKQGVDAPPRALLRVVGPPYYTLLRAIDRIGGAKAPVAYIEKSPRVWVELGYTHPLIQEIKAPPGKLLLLRPSCPWTMLAEAPFRDVYETTEFLLPDGVVKFNDSKNQTPRIKVTLSLRAGGPPEGDEFWVLRDDPLEHLNHFVQNNTDEVLQRLSFAVGERSGKKIIVVRVRPSKQPAPVVILHGAIGYKPYLKLPNLFLPVGTKLYPPLRRDQVRKLLAEDTSQVVWLHPDGKGSFVPQTLPEDSFRPLFDWVYYVLDHDKEPLQHWVQAAQFVFEPFASEEEAVAKPKRPPGSSEKASRGRTRINNSEGPDARYQVIEETIPTLEPTQTIEEMPVVLKVEPSLAQKQLKELEEAFLALEGGLDSAQRQELWPRLAALNTSLKNVDDAGISWMNVLWERDEATARAWAWSWFAVEAQAVQERTTAQPWTKRALESKNRELPGDDLDRLLNLSEPATSDIRTLAAYLVHACLQEVPSASLVERLGPISRFLETNEKLLPIRGMWLAWSHLAILSRGDVLAVVRARDRVLERLYHTGMRPEQDLPSFLRFAGQPTSQRFRAVRQWLIGLSDLAQDWVTTTGTQGQTKAYVDLIFAFGLARLGESDEARKRLAHATIALNENDDAAHKALLSAFDYRIRLALDGKPHIGPLPADQLNVLENMERLSRYVVDRLRKHSRIIEPDTVINPYRHWGARINEFERELVELADETDRNLIVNRVENLLRDIPRGAKGAEQRMRVLKAGLENAPRVNEEFARRLLDNTIPTYDALPEIKEVAVLVDQASFLEKALFTAGHFGRTESLHPLVTRFKKMLESQRGTQAINALESLASQCLRGLRRLGMREEIDQILRMMETLILEGQDVRSVDWKKRDNGPAALRALLQVASGYYFFGKDAQADQILGVARAVLFAADLPQREQTQLAVAYARAAGQAQVEAAQKRLEEIFKSLKNVRDTYTTSTHFSVSQLDVVEAVVLAVVSDDFTVGTQARRWLDDDEFLVRRRIHRDVRAALEREV